MSRKAIATFLLLLVSYVVTIVMSINGPILPLIQKELGLDYISSGLLFSMIAAGLLVTTLPASMLGERLGGKNALIIAIFGTASCQFFISLTETPFMAYIFLFFTGLCLGPVIALFQGALSDLHGEQRSRVLSLSAMFASIGSLSAPIIANIITSTFQALAWRRVYQTTALAMLLLGFLLLAFLEKKELTLAGSQTMSLRKLAELLKNKGVLRFTGAASLGAAIEWTFSFWLVSYLVGARSISLSSSQLTLSAFYGSMLIGRFINSAIAKPQYIRWIMVGSVLMGLAGSVLVLFTLILIPGVILVGLALSGMYPLSLGQAISFNPKSSTAVSAVVVECVYAVSMVLPALAGIVSSTQGISVGIGIALVSFIPLLFILIPQSQREIE